MASQCTANTKDGANRFLTDDVRKFQRLKQECLKQHHSKKQHPAPSPTSDSVPEEVPLFGGTKRRDIRLQRYLNQQHHFVNALSGCFGAIVPFLTVADLTRLSAVCGILNNWVMAETVRCSLNYRDSP